MDRTTLSNLVTVVLLFTAAPPAAGLCPGDCNGDGGVTVEELVTAVNLALDGEGAGECDAADADGDGAIGVDELVAAVGSSLLGCEGRLPEDLRVPDGFDYATSREVHIDVTVHTPNGAPFPGATVSVLEPEATRSGTPELLWRGSTDLHGRYAADVRVPARFTALRVVASTFGTVNDVVVPVIGGRIALVFGADPDVAVPRNGGRR